jgi:hypothetical protein
MMTDERLLARLRGRGNKDTIAAADRIEALTAELAKAVEALREIAGECGCSTARAIIAEIEGSNAP